MTIIEQLAAVVEAAQESDARAFSYQQALLRQHVYRPAPGFRDDKAAESESLRLRDSSAQASRELRLKLDALPHDWEQQLRAGGYAEGFAAGSAFMRLERDAAESRVRDLEGALRGLVDHIEALGQYAEATKGRRFNDDGIIHHNHAKIQFMRRGFAAMQSAEAALAPKAEA